MSKNTFAHEARACLSVTFVLRPSRRYWRLAHLALLGSVVGSAVAAEQHQHHSLELTPMIITGVAQQSPLTVVTDPKIPRQPVPAGDAGDYLQTIPGFSAVRGGGSNSDPVFRGMFGSRLNMLTNGGVMLGACPSRMDSPSSYITPQSYDQLTVIKGPQTVLWGPGGSAATILFEREPERFSEFGGRVDASLLVGSDGRFDRAIDAATGSDLGYLRLLANRSDSDNYSDGNGDRLHSRWDKWSSDLVIGWTPDTDTLLELTAGIGDGEAAYAGRGMDGSQFERESLGLRFERENLGEVLQKIEARLYYNYADHVMDNFSLRTPSGSGMMANPMASNVDRRTLGGRVAGTWAWDAYELVAGIDAQTNEHRKRASTFSMMGGYTSHERASWSKDAGFHNYGAFAELSWSAAEGDRVIGGARLDRASAKDYRQRLSNSMGGNWANPSANSERSDTLPSAFVRYEHDLNDLPATAYLGLGHAQRFPDYWELFSASTGPVGSVQAFETVRPEKTTQLDFGIQYEHGPLSMWASGYVGQVRDYILFNYVPMGMMTRTSVDNVEARIMGGELGGSYRLSPAWKTDASLAYAWGENRSDDRPMPQIPPLEGRLGLTYERGDWSAAGLWRVVAKQSRVAEGQGNVTSKDFGDSAGFGVLSVNGAYRLNKHYRVSTGIDNLLDKAYSEHLNQAGSAGFGYAADTRINEPGRTYWARVDLSF